MIAFNSLLPGSLKIKPAADNHLKLIDKATSEDLPLFEPDISLNLEISDLIKCNKLGPKQAIDYILKRLETTDNPNVKLLVFELLDLLVKNTGMEFIQLTIKEDNLQKFINILDELSLKENKLKLKILQLMNDWHNAFGNDEICGGPITQTHQKLLNEGYELITNNNNTSKMLFETKTAPKWTDSDYCERCKIEFSVTNRKHHCRNCGRTLCKECCNDYKQLLHFGINEKVRVCNRCSKQKNKLSNDQNKPNVDLKLRKKSETGEIDQFEKDLKKALELSLINETSNQPASTYKEFKGSPKLHKIQDNNLDNTTELSKKRKPETKEIELNAKDLENIKLFRQLVKQIKKGNIENDKNVRSHCKKIEILKKVIEEKMAMALKKFYKYNNYDKKLKSIIKHNLENSDAYSSDSDTDDKSFTEGHEKMKNSKNEGGTFETSKDRAIDKSDAPLIEL